MTVRFLLYAFYLLFLDRTTSQQQGNVSTGNNDNELNATSATLQEHISRTDEYGHQNLTDNVADADSIYDIDLEVDYPSLLSQFCPGGSVCVNDTSHEKSGKSTLNTSCCTACSCSDNCKATRNCCFPLNNSDIIKPTRCYSTLYPSLEVSEGMWFKSYIMIDSVTTNNGQDLSSECGNTNVAPWGSLYPVYSKSRHAIYKNSVCAAAHGVEDYIRFKTFVACFLPVLLSRGAMFAGEVWEFFDKDCDVWFEFPDGYYVEIDQQCFQYLVSTCPEHFDTDTSIQRDHLKAACNSDLVSPYKDVRNIFYKNVFCAICNGAYRQQVCFTQEPKSRYNRDYLVLLEDTAYDNFNKGSDLKQVEQVCLIRDGEKVEGTCRPVVCPSGQIYTGDGACRYILKTWYKSSVVVYLQLIPGNLFNTAGLGKDDFTSQWTKVWDIIMIYYFPVNDSMPSITNKIMVILKRKFDKINPQFMIQNVRKLKRKPWAVRTTDETVSMNADFMDVRDRHQNVLNGNREFRYIYNRDLQMMSYVIDRMTYCKQVYLTSEEFTIHDKYLYINFTGNYLHLDDYYFPNVQDKSIVRVCVEDSRLSYAISGCHASVGTYYMLILFMFVNV